MNNNDDDNKKSSLAKSMLVCPHLSRCSLNYDETDEMKRIVRITTRPHTQDTTQFTQNYVWELLVQASS